jgi:transcriptional antiterminator RfaH
MVCQSDKVSLPAASQRDDLWGRTHWYAVQSKPSREAFAAANVDRLGIPVLLPQFRHRYHRRGVRAIGVKPLFTGYFFARFTPSACLDKVRYARGVLRIVSSGHIALPVDDAVIEAIKAARTGDDGLVEIGAPRLRAGARVRVEAGPLAGLFGVLERESDDHTRVTLLLEALHSAHVVIDRDCVAVADAA